MSVLNNLPYGCSSEDLDAYLGGRPVSEDEAKECIVEELLEEGYSEEEITDELVDEYFRKNFYFVRYSRRNGGSGYVHC